MHGRKHSSHAVFRDLSVLCSPPNMSMRAHSLTSRSICKLQRPSTALRVPVRCSKLAAKRAGEVIPSGYLHQRPAWLGQLRVLSIGQHVASAYKNCQMLTSCDHNRAYSWPTAAKGTVCLVWCSPVLSCTCWFAGPQEEKEAAHEAFMQAFEASKPVAVRMPGLQQFAASVSSSLHAHM